MFKTNVPELIRRIDAGVLADVRSLYDAFRAYGRELYLVGGCVRDLLLGVEPHDYDLCTDAKPSEVKEILSRHGEIHTIDTGLRHGTLTAMYGGRAYEITTYRSDGKYSDGRHPDGVEFVLSLEEDMKRRDFTINAFAYDVVKGEILALDESALRDLEFKSIRAVGNPMDRFGEDALRMLRAVRFSAQLGFSIEGGTFAAIRPLAKSVLRVSPERVREELTKILMSERPRFLRLLIDSGLDEFVWGPYYKDRSTLRKMMDTDQHNKYHYTDVFHHTVDAIARSPKDPAIRWALLLHDTGKVETRTTDEGGHDHFYGHAEASAEIAERIMRHFRFSNEFSDKVVRLVRLHDRALSGIKRPALKRLINDVGEDLFPTYLEVRRADMLAHDVKNFKPGTLECVDEAKAAFEDIVRSNDAMGVKDLAIDGNDIVADGFLKGREIGECLRWMLNIVIERPEENTRERLLERLEQFKEMSFQNS